MRTFKTIILIFVAALVSCGQTENLYSNFRCYFYFDNSTHNDATLATAMTPYSGTFTTISLSAGKFVFSNNQGLNSVVNMIKAGVRVFKIEGRARGPEYVHTVVSCYKEAIQAVCDGTFTDEKKDEWDQRLSTVFNRGFWDGYYQGQTMQPMSPPRFT